MKKMFLILLAFTVFSCGKNFGTNTGNPDQQGQEEPVPACGDSNGRCMPAPFVVMTAASITSKIDICLGGDGNNIGSDSPIYQAIFNQNGLSEELPVAEDSFAELNIQYNSKKIHVDIPSYNPCMSAIRLLDCNSSKFTDAYDVHFPSDYSNIHKIFRADPACLTTFTDK